MSDAPNIFPALRYRDARAAIEWLGTALGFEQTMVVDGPDGSVAHAQLAFGPGMIMLGSAGAGDDSFDQSVGASSVYLATDDPDAVFEQAKAAGATVARDIADTDYGSREFTVRDPEGNLWSVGSYRPSREDS
jgi:uncharacterized glyoxalase superfamily protein PhnB